MHHIFAPFCRTLHLVDNARTACGLRVSLAVPAEAIPKPTHNCKNCQRSKAQRGAWNAIKINRKRSLSDEE